MIQLAGKKDFLCSVATGPLTILLVEDDQASRDELALMLSRAGFCCEAAPDGWAALAKLKTQRFDVIIADLMMPELSGLELFSEIRRAFADMHPLRILISGAAKAEDCIEALRLDVDDIFLKPIDTRALLRRIRRMQLGVEPGPVARDVPDRASPEENLFLARSGHGPHETYMSLDAVRWSSQKEILRNVAPKISNSMEAFQILAELLIHRKNGDAITVKSIARRRFISFTTAVRILAELEKVGLTEKKVDSHDHRRRVIKLTEKGEQLVNEMLGVNVGHGEGAHRSEIDALG